MDIWHLWLIKMIAIQLICAIGAVAGIRYLLRTRLAPARIAPAVSPRELRRR